VNRLPRDRVGLAIGKDSMGNYQAVVAISTEINPTQMRDLAYSIGQEVGNSLTEEEQTRLKMRFKGKQAFWLDHHTLGQAWNDFHRNRSLLRELGKSLYTWGNTRKAKSIAEAIAEYMRLPEPQIAPVRDPSLPDHVFESKIIPL